MKVNKGRETGSDKKTEETGLLNAAYKPGLDPELGRVAMKDILGIICVIEIRTID